MHSFSNSFTRPAVEYVTFPKLKPINATESIAAKLSELQETPKVEFFKITTVDNVEMDGWMVKPTNFDPSKKYPLVFYVYSEPARATVTDTYGVGRNYSYNGNMADDGTYFYTYKAEGFDGTIVEGHGFMQLISQ